MMKILRLAIVGGVVLSGFVVMGWSQQGFPKVPNLPDPQAGPLQPGGDRRNAANAAGNDTAVNPMDVRQMKTRNTDRQKRLSDDSDRLLAVAAELKEEMEKTAATVDVAEAAKKAEEIERLAKSVKDHMKS